MPDRKQIIVISVLCVLALMLGYFWDTINISIGQRVEVQEPDYLIQFHPRIATSPRSRYI